jgi:hypothetical protein
MVLLRSRHSGAEDGYGDLAPTTPNGATSMLLITLAALTALWAMVVVVVIGLCVSAARGDRMLAASRHGAQRLIV